MSTFEVTTELVIHTEIKLLVEAPSKEEALELAAELLPANYAPERSREWGASVRLTKKPKGVCLTTCRPFYFEQSSGNNRARKMPDQPRSEKEAG